MSAIPNWPPTYEGSTGSPDDRLADVFIRLSEDYPQSLVGVGPALGNCALDMVDRDEMPWQTFVDSELSGDGLDRAVRRIHELHAAAGVPINPQLPQILPKVYQLAKSSIIMSIAEYMKQMHGKQLDGLTIADSAITAQATDFLTHTAPYNAAARRHMLMQLLRPGIGVLLEPGGVAQYYGATYRDALVGRQSDLFPVSASTGRKKELLAQYVRPLMMAAAAPVVAGLSMHPYQANTLIYNITRP